jgi:hypothetical protein
MIGSMNKGSWSQSPWLGTKPHVERMLDGPLVFKQTLKKKIVKECYEHGLSDDHQCGRDEGVVEKN